MRMHEKEKEEKGREGNGMEGKGREGKGREGQGRALNREVSLHSVMLGYKRFLTFRVRYITTV